MGLSELAVQGSTRVMQQLTSDHLLVRMAACLKEPSSPQPVVSCFFLCCPAFRVDAVQQALVSVTGISLSDQIVMCHGARLDPVKPLAAYKLPVVSICSFQLLFVQQYMQQHSVRSSMRRMGVATRE